MEKRTPLYETHVALGGKMVPFGGYEMPVQYPAGVIGEHMAVRQKAGLFDVSHMAELLLETRRPSKSPVAGDRGPEQNDRRSGEVRHALQ